MSKLNVRSLLFILSGAVLGHLVSFFFLGYTEENTLACAGLFMAVIDIGYRVRQGHLDNFPRWFGGGGGSAAFLPVWLFGIGAAIYAWSGHANL